MSSRKGMIFALSALALTSGFYFRQPAQANDLDRVLDFLRGSRQTHMDVDRLTARVSNRLEEGRADGRLTGREYRRLRRELDIIMSDRAQMAYGGLNWSEAQSLRNRLTNLDYRTTA